MEGLRADIVHALRLYRKTPASTMLAVAVLATAMAIVTAFVSLWNHLGLRSHPGFEASGNLITVGINDGRRFFPIAGELLDLIGAEATSVESVAGVAPSSLELVRDDETTPLNAEIVTADYFPGLRPRLALGRPFDAADHDPDAEPVAILSQAFWQEEYAGRPDVLGQTVRIRDAFPRPPSADGAEDAPKVEEYRIVGVLAAELPATFGGSTDVWLPYEQFASFVGPNRTSLFRTVARLAPGVSVERARNELEGRFGDAALDSLSFPGRIDAIAGVVGDANRQRETLRQVRLFLAGGVLLALVAAANVSLFLLSRAPGRRRELAIRMAVGAPVRRLARQLVTESSVLVLGGALLGLLASLWLSVVVRELPFLRGRQWGGFSAFDWRVLTIVGAFTLLLAMLVALAPVAGLRRIGIAAESRTVTARPGFGQRLAGAVQLVVAAVTGAAALAFAWHLNAMTTADRGFSAPNVYVLSPEPPERPRGFRPVDEAGLAERERRRQAILSLPGVTSVSFATGVPGTAALTFLLRASSADDPTDIFGFDQFNVGIGYFDMLGIRLVSGRTFAENDRDGMIINETLARRIWGRTDVAGEVVPLSLPSQASPERHEVIGVIGDVMFGHPSEEVPPLAFRLLAGGAPFELILAESTLASAELKRLIDQETETGELDLSIRNVEHVEDAWLRRLAPDRARMAVAAATALFVVVLAAFGYYGTQRFLVGAGRREYAILGALGAGPRALGRLALRRGVVQGLPGLVVGAVLGFIVVAWLREDFVSRESSPSAIALIVTAGVAALLLAATWGPARQASRTEPAPLLKEE